MKINIIGLGTAGLASAIFLTERGHEVTVYEAADELKPVGAGLLLQPTGLEALIQLGLQEEALKYGARIDSLIGSTLSDRKVLDLHYKDLQASSFGLGIHRASLFHILFSKFQSLNIKLVTGSSIIKYHHYCEQVEIYDDNGYINSCDLLVVANGARSKLRKQSPYFISDKEYPWGAIWGITPLTQDVKQHCLQQKYQLAHTMIGLLPTGKLPNSKQELVSLFWSLPVSMLNSLSEFDLDNWKDKCAQQWPLTESILDQIGCKEQIAFATYRDVKMRQFNHKQVVYIGDAAHGMSPQLGQGANMALIDAYFLSKIICKKASIENSLKQYNQLRIKHINYYQFMSRWLTPFYQSNSRILGSIKDYTSYPASKVPFIKNQMLNTLFGKAKYGGLLE